jgi:hypothetical protein
MNVSGKVGEIIGNIWAECDRTVALCKLSMNCKQGIQLPL